MTRRFELAVAAILTAAACASASAHETRPAYLELRQTGPDTYEVLWSVPVPLAIGGALDVRLPEGCAPAGPAEQVDAADAFVDRWTVRCPGGLEGRSIAIDGLRPVLADALVRIERSDGTTQIILLTPDQPSFTASRASPRIAVAATYLRLGIEHILGGVDHLLFVLGLLLIVRNRWMLVKTVTAFTVAHSITLAAATLGRTYPPVGTLNALIAMSILFLGPEIVRAQRGGTSLTIRHPWVVAFAFGLLHGFGFASGLADLGLPAGEIPLALLMFNVGVEAGQLAFVALLLGLGLSLRVLEFRWSSWQQAVPAYVVGSLGAAWTIERVLALVG